MNAFEFLSSGSPIVEAHTVRKSTEEREQLGIDGFLAAGAPIKVKEERGTGMSPLQTAHSDC